MTRQRPCIRLYRGKGYHLDFGVTGLFYRAWLDLQRKLPMLRSIQNLGHMRANNESLNQRYLV